MLTAIVETVLLPRGFLWPGVEFSRHKFSVLEGKNFSYVPSKKRELRGFYPYKLVSPSFFQKVEFRYLTFARKNSRGGLIFREKGKYLWVFYSYGNQREKVLLLSYLAHLFPAKQIVFYIFHNISLRKKLVKKGGKLEKRFSFPLQL